MALIERFEDIRAWQQARDLVKDIDLLSGSGEFVYDFTLRDQIRRAAVSAMTNIAEGFDCTSRKEFVRFLSIARRSAVEVQSLLYVAPDIGYIDQITFTAQYDHANRTRALIGGFITSLSKRM